MSRQYVGIDFHRQRSYVIRKDFDGTVLSKERITNSVENLARVVEEAGERPEVIIEAAYGWYWAVDLLHALDCNVHLAAPSGLNWGQRRVKNDERDANDLIDLLRVGRLPEAWIAPPATRELRELVRYRAKLVGLRTSMKTQVQAVLAKEGVYPKAVGDLGAGRPGRTRSPRVGARLSAATRLAPPSHLELRPGDRRARGRHPRSTPRRPRL
jgi:transposase